MAAEPVIAGGLDEAPAARPAATLLVCLPALSGDDFRAVLDNVAAAFPQETVMLAATSPDADMSAWPALQRVAYKTERSETGWVLAAGDYNAAAATAIEHGAQAVLVLSDNATAANPPLLRGLAGCVLGKKIDLAVPRFRLGPSDGLVNAALLYPLTRALFGAEVHAPLTVHAALSIRMAERISAAKRQPAGQGPLFLWPVSEAAVAGLSVREVDAGDAAPPQPPEGDFNSLFSSVAGSLFSDIEAKATFWQRARSMPARARLPPQPADAAGASGEVQSMIDNFHLAQANLQEIWSLVLPPQSRLELKRLSQQPPELFAMTPSLWARVVYDFVLAYHLRTLNRGHLLGAMTPLYLAWAAGHLRRAEQDPALASLALEHTAAAFEDEKPYLVSRWRWPDRFNP